VKEIKTDVEIMVKEGIKALFVFVEFALVYIYIYIHTYTYYIHAYIYIHTCICIYVQIPSTGNDIYDNAMAVCWLAIS